MSARLSVGIIGAGPGGLALGTLPSRAGFHNFTIFAREDDVGGTWRLNSFEAAAMSAAEGEAVAALDRQPR
jgi:cation diffusion facilitator CzcD-associated flavoprotein CzcO